MEEIKTFLIKTELEFAELLYGDNVVEMAKNVPDRANDKA